VSYKNAALVCMGLAYRCFAERCGGTLLEANKQVVTLLYLVFWSPLAVLCTTRCTIHKSYVLRAECVCVLCM